MPDIPHTKRKKVSPLITQGWMLLGGLFWIFRFWGVKKETLWFITLDVYKGDDSIDLLTVSLARDGIFSLLAGTALLLGFTSVIRHHIKEQAQNE